jgi:Zn-finger nucleic acid-binding protein
MAEFAPFTGEYGSGSDVLYHSAPFLHKHGSRRLNCPVCDKPMVTFEIQGVELDHCVKCKGTWLDAGEMELLLDGAAEAEELLGSMVPDEMTSEAKRRCPICEKPMHKVKYACGDAMSVTLD